MGPEVIKGDMTGTRIQTFFDTQGAVIVAAKRKDVNGQCTKKDGDCRGKEIRDSRYNDMKGTVRYRYRYPCVAESFWPVPCDCVIVFSW